MKESNYCQSSHIIEIVPNGDIIFAVGPEMARIHIQSQLLKAAFNPLFTMLRKEAHDMLLKYELVELSLPQDNAVALKIIFAIIYKQDHHMVPWILISIEILDVTISVDKYGFVNFITIASGNWPQPGLQFVKDLIPLAAAAYLFQNAQGFKEITEALVYWKNSEALSG